MATEVKRRRGTTVEHSTFTGAVAELTVDLTKDTVVVHDGATQGGFPLLREDFDNVPTTAPFTHITLDTAIFDTTYTETGSETQGTLYWNSDEETLSLVTNGESIELGQKVEIHVKNQTGTQIDKGEVVYASGTVGASGRILVTKMIADGTVAAKRVLGVAAENIANGADGKVIKFGKLRQINTSTFSNGDILWVSTTVAGAFQNTEPSQSAGDIALPIAYVVYSSASVGEIFIRVTPIDENKYTDYSDYVELRSDVIENHLEIESLQDNKVEKGQLFPDGDEQALGTGDAVTFSTINTGQGDNELYAMNQNVRTTDAVTFSTVDTGQGANELYAMNQDVQTSDSPTFDGLTSTGVIITDEIDTTSITWNVSTLEWDADPSEKFNNPVFIGTSLDVDNGINADQHIHAGSYLKADTYLEVGTSATIGTTLDVGTNATVGGTLDVTGATTLSTLDVSGNTTVGGTLNVTGNTTISGTLDAPTLNTGQGDNELYAMNQDVQTTDGVIFDTLSVTNNASVGGSLTLTGEADFNSTMNLQGNLTTQANLADDGFVEGWAGTNWRIKADGSAELEELRVRGALRVYEFIAKQISTIGGSEILSIANGRVESVDNASSPKTITIDNVGSPATSFQAGDLWIIQEVDINSGSVTSVYGEVDAVVSGNVLQVTVTSGDLSQVEQGNIIVAYGHIGDTARQNVMYRNVDASEDNLIMRLQTGVTDFSELQDVDNTRVAFGDLNGYSSLSSQTFGFFAGENANEHVLITDSGIFFKDGSTVGAQLTANEFKIGDANNNLSFNTDTGAFNIKIGDETDLAASVAELRQDLIDIYLADQSTFAGIQFLSGQITLKVGADGKVASARLDATGDESAITLRADFFDFQSNDIVLIGDPNQDAGTEAKIALGSNVDTITVTNTDSGFIATGAGEFKGYIDASNYIRLNSSGLNINAELFNLDTGDIRLTNNYSSQNSDYTSSVTYSDTLQFAGLFFDSDNYLGHITDVDTSANSGYLFRVGGNTSNFIEVNEAGGIAKINFDTFTLDATDASGGIKIDSANELIQLEDANRVRTQIDVNNGAPTVSPTSEINDTTNNAFDKDASYTTSSFQVTNGDSIRVKVTAQLIDISSLDADDNFQFEVRLLSSSTSGGTYTQVGSTVISELFNGTDEFNSDTVTFSYHTYGNEYFKVQVSAQSVDADPADDPQFQTTLIDVDSFPSVTRVSLDGVFIQNNDLQYAQFTRTKNELSGQIFLKNLPDSDPSISGQLYRDSSGNLKVSL